LRKVTATEDLTTPKGEIDLTAVEQGDDHPQISGEMRLVSPRTSLTSPSVKASWRRELGFTAFQGCGWYFDL